jgi:hypothetical protein
MIAGECIGISNPGPGISIEGIRNQGIDIGKKTPGFSYILP